LIEIINKQLLLQLVGYLCYWQMGFNSVFKGLIRIPFIQISHSYQKKIITNQVLQLDSLCSGFVF